MDFIYLQNLVSVFLLFSFIAWIALMIRTIYIIRSTPSIKIKERACLETPFISILLPVRNEASRILEQNIKSLANQNYPNFEVIVINDRSTDNSSSIIKDIQAKYPNKIKYISGKEPPKDWVGKTHAMAQAKEIAQGEWLATVDADVVFSPYILNSSVELMITKQVDALSLLPKVEMESFSEKLIIPIMCWLSIMRVSPTQANSKRSKYCFGYGNFIMFRRSAHDAIGGFEEYKNNILDDCAIMEKLKSANYNVMIVDGYQLMTSRMYRNLGEIISGFGKNSFAALNYKIWKVLIFIGILILLVYFPVFYLLIKPFVSKFVEISLIDCFAIGAILLNILTIYFFGKKMQLNGKASYFFWLLGFAIAEYIILYSMTKVITGSGVKWKDRTVKIYR